MINTEIVASAYRRLRASLLPSEGEDAADALQEVFCRLWSRRSSLASQPDLERMGARSLRNALIDMMRRRKFSSIEEAQEAVEEPASAEVGGLYQEVSALMKRALSERDRNILRLREAYGWSSTSWPSASGCRKRT